jgi:uncharacterized membrane protein YedE/YeeE
MTDVVHLAGGGALIGAGAAVLVLANGRIAGISGVLGSLLQGDAGPGRYRLGFLLGLVLPGLYLLLGDVQVAMAGNVGWLLAAGLLVGIGTRVGSGCTSGHGVCGIANLSRRSLAATLVFMGAAMLTVFLVRHVAG